MEIYRKYDKIENATKINPSGAIKIFAEHIAQNADQILKAFHKN